MTTIFYRHGDIILAAGAEIPASAARQEREGRLVIAEGEATGHAHAIDDAGAELYVDEDTNTAFLRVLAEAGVELVHDEHATLTLPPGDYLVGRQREWTDADEPRQVAD